MEVVNFDATAAKVLSAGGRIAMPKFAVPGVCWQGYFIDAEGNTFGLFQPDPAAK
jgi:predicted enzyme related to lactoylglutathione lyase